MAESKDPSAPTESRARRVREWLRRLALVPVRYEVQHAAALPAGTIWYVLETDRYLDRRILDDLCIRRGWPLPIR